MAGALGWKINLHGLSLLALLCGCINLGHSSQSFMIGEKYIPASPDYLSVYIVTEGEDLNIRCNHTQTGSSGWFAESVDRTVPQGGDPITIGGNLVAADNDTLLFLNPATAGLEGIYSCAGDTLRIFLTFDNPYVNIEGPDPLSIMLVDVFQLVAVTLYKVDGEQMSAELSTVTVTATETGDLNIVGTSASDPYRTMYEVARADGLVQATLTLKVEVNGMSGSDSVNLLVEDLYEGLKAATVVLEGDTVMLNCTPTLPDATVTFSGSAVSEFPHDNVLSFPALERLDGFYRCTVVFPSSTSITQTTTVYIVPEDRGVLYYRDGQLPTPYIVLNDPRSEGLFFTCITTSGTLTVTSENTTITEQIAAISGIGSVDVGGNEVFDVVKGDQFIQIEIFDLDSVYGDTLTCKSSDFPDSASMVVAPGGTYVALYPDNDITMVTADYGQSINISFFYVTVQNSPIELLRNGEDITQQAEFGQNPPVLPDHNQVRYYEVTLNASSAGLYILPNNGAGSPNASFLLNVNLPTVTVSPEDLQVEEGETFTITCTSSISSLPLVWLVPETPVEFSGPNSNQATVISADRNSEGTYTCQFREGGTVLASAITTVNVLLRCPEDYAGGILWSSVVEDTVATASCRDADSRFSSGLVVTRICNQGEWLGPNFSGCTLTSGEPQAFIIFSLHYQVLSGSETEIRASEDTIKNELDATTMRTSPQSTSLEIVPGFAQFPSDGFSVDIVRLRYIVSYNISATSNFELFELLPGVNRDLHCFTNIMTEIINLRAGTFPVVGDSYGFQRSDFCECRTSSGLRGLVQEQRRRKRGDFCSVPSPNFQEICNGTLAAPCNCEGLVGTESVSTECQCMDPFVGDDSLCTLDQDSDSYPALPLRTCGEGDNATYCIEDSCPTVPNIDPTDNSSCTGLDVASCEAEIDEVWQIVWPFTPTNEVATVPCGADFIGLSSRQCLTNGSWAVPDVSNCSSRVFVSVQARAAGLSVVKNREEVIFLLDELVVATNETVTPVFPQDLEISNDLVNDTLTQLFEQLDMGGEGNLNDTDTIFELLDNLLVDVNLPSFEVLQEAGAGSERVLDNVERYALYVARVLQEGNMPDLTINQTGDNIVLRAESIPAVGMVEDYVFPEAGEADGLAVTNGSEASITIPQELLLDRAEGDSVGVAHLLFRNLQAFLPNDIVSTEPESLVISSQVSRRGGTAFVEEVLVDNPVLITFSFEVVEGSDLSTSDVQCVFWDFGNSDSDLDLSGWSTEAVRTVSVMREGDTVTVTCASTHLTSFAVLVDVGGAQLESEALTIVSYIGLAISLACLLLTIVFFLTFGKNLFTAVHNFVHLNLAIALFIGYLIFAIGLELAKDNEIACNAVTALIQYFLLSAFCWMMCEGVMLYLMLVVVFTKISKKWWFFLLLGWGPPLIFVVIGLATVHDEYGVKDESGDYKYCWLSSGDGTYAIWTFVAPMLAIIIINAVFLVLVLYSIFRNRAGRHKSVQEGIKVDVVITVVKASLILLPLLGLTWVFGLFAVNENTAVFAWLFTIFNSLQGVFIFFFHVVRNDRIWGRMKKKYSAYATSRASKSTASTGTGKHTSHAHRLGYSSNVGTELKEKESYVSEHRASEVKVSLDEPTKEEPA